MTRVVLSLILAVALAAGIARATAASEAVHSPEEKGRSIAAERERREDGFGDMVAEVTMLLTSADGRVRNRRLTWKVLEPASEHEGEKSLALFHEPRDIAGTAFLSFTHVDQPDDQWLYLPALKRTKRISSASKASSFVGSEFAYEDLLSDEPQKFEHRWIRDEACGELTCFVLERRPLYEDSGYEKQVVWIDHEEYRLQRIQYHDRKGRHQKTLSFRAYRQHLRRFWRADELYMENHQSEKATTLRFDAISLGTGLSEEDFIPSSLRRLR